MTVCRLRMRSRQSISSLTAARSRSARNCGIAVGRFADGRFVEADELGRAAPAAAEAEGEADVVLQLVIEDLGSSGGHIA